MSLIELLIVVLLPALDLYIFQLHGSKGLDECLCQTDIRHQGDIVVDGTTPNLIAISELARGVVLWHIDNQTNLVLHCYLQLHQAKLQ